jgi:hypothetical protein
MHTECIFPVCNVCGDAFGGVILVWVLGVTVYVGVGVGCAEAGYDGDGVCVGGGVGVDGV